ncbi:MAG: FtsH protease activity modulator HflK [Chromatiales bacterium]|jgi:membrane protease subunit HflK|nr:FtsH protease activity modulator HflK [Chromatiales bacterium]
MKPLHEAEKAGQQMAWNEPGGSRGGKDPWSGQGDGQQQGGPPDLDEVVRKMQEKFNGLFGGRRGGANRSGGGRGPGRAASFGISTIVVVILGLWLISGFYIVNAGSQGVVLRFGSFHHLADPGLNWRIPYPIDSVDVINVDQIRTAEIGYRTNTQGARGLAGESLMLTQDENIVDIKLAIQYRIKDAKDYLFNVLDPDLTLAQATESALREIIGKSTMDFVLTEGRAEVVARVNTLIQQILDNYQAGLQVTSVNMQDAQPPEEVQHAFDDAVKAREDEERLRNEAETYSNDILPRARGQAARAIEEANAYQAQVIAQAEGDASRFTQIVQEYHRAPAVMRDRLYIETIESIMKNVSKVIVDVDKGSNMLLLPVDRLMSGELVRQNDNAAMPRAGAATSTPSPMALDNPVERPRANLREREVR